MLVDKIIRALGHEIDVRVDYVSYAIRFVEKHGFIIWKWKKDFKLCGVITKFYIYVCVRARAHEIMHKMRIVKYLGQVMQILWKFTKWLIC